LLSFPRAWPSSPRRPRRTRLIGRLLSKVTKDSHPLSGDPVAAAKSDVAG
jgi:hypothetical protein